MRDQRKREVIVGQDANDTSILFCNCLAFDASFMSRHHAMRISSHFIFFFIISLLLAFRFLFFSLVIIPYNDLRREERDRERERGVYEPVNGVPQTAQPRCSGCHGMLKAVKTCPIMGPPHDEQCGKLSDTA